MPLLMRAMSAVVLILSLVSAAHAKVWDAREVWDEGWEEKYSEWIAHDVHEEIFTRGEWGGLSTDCADALYALRIIFSYQHSLPFRTANLSAGNNTDKFDKLKAGPERVKAFIDYVAISTFTKSLSNDTYPIQINTDSMKPGVIWLRSSVATRNPLLRWLAEDVSRHTETIKEVTKSGVIYLLGSTVPRKIRNLNVSTSLMYAPENKDLGFRRWIWPQNYKAAPESYHQYSLEQFRMGRSIRKYTESLKARLAIVPETEDELISRLTKDLCTMAQLRNEVVQDALKRNRENPVCAVMPEYDLYSTPSRDKRMRQSLQDLFKAAHAGTFLTPETKRVKKITMYFDQCRPIITSDNRHIPMSMILMNLISPFFSSDPNDHELRRWGFAGPKKTCQQPAQSTPAATDSTNPVKPASLEPESFIL